MNPLIHQLQDLFAGLGVPQDLVPLCPFLLGIVVIYGILFILSKVLISAGITSAKTVTFYVFISPWLLGFFLFTLGPIVYALYLSGTKWNLINPPQWVGFDNFVHAAQDSRVYQSLLVTFYYAFISVPLNVGLSFLLSLVMNVKLRGIYFFRTVFYLPLLVSGVAQAVLFSRVFDPNTGIINSALAFFGIKGPLWLLDPNWALWAVVIMNLWTVGGNMIIYLAGLQDIPMQLYEAADLDGATTFQKLWHVTVPQMTPILFFNLLTGIIAAMQVFTPAYLFGRGGPGDSLLFFVYYLFLNAFSFFQMGYGAALGWILFVIILILTVLVLRSSRSWVYYETEQEGGR